MTPEEQAAAALVRGRVAEGANGETIFTLDEPQQFCGKEVTELKFPPLKGGHLRAMAKANDGFGKMMAVAEAMTGYPQSFFDEMAGNDCLAVAALVEAILGKRKRATGS